jgi:beta-galactosidase
MSDLTMQQPSLGVCYYPEHWQESCWEEDAQRMSAMGIRYVRIGEFAWGRIEPRPGQFEWEWLDRAIAILASQGLSIILGTPTACPPKWLVDQHPEILAVAENGQVRGFGSRRHYCFSSAAYRRESRRIVTAIAQRYGSNPAIVAWQTDNEYGCHDTVVSYSSAAKAAFRHWLHDKYGTIETLNAAWGNVFWSMEYGCFDEVELPVATVTEANPIHRLDFQRFSSDQVAAFNKEQVDILRERAVAADLVHNYMGRSTDFDHFRVGADLDVASWDSYPLGFLEQSAADESRKAHFRQQGDPDFTAFHHDLYRAVGSGRWWVMEQQPGPVNWAPFNAAPLPGMVRLWALEAFAHGAELVSFFRWRQAPFAQEQNHAGVLLPNSEEAPAAQELRQTFEDISALDWQPTENAPVALLFSYEAKWLIDIQPQAEGFCAFTQALAYYSELRRLGVDVDIVSPEANLDGYRVVVAPCLPILPEQLVESLKNSSAIVLFGPRAGSKTDDYQIPAQLPPGSLQQLLQLQVTHVDSIRAGVSLPLAGGDAADSVHTWLEHVAGNVDARVATESGAGVWYQQDRVHYLTACVSSALLAKVLRAVLTQADVVYKDMPRGVRVRRRGNLCFAFNYACEERTTPCGDSDLLMGGRTLMPAEVAVWQTKQR